MPRLLLCSPAAEGSRAAQLLKQRGLQLKVSGTTTADVVLPVRGGSLSFLLFDDAEGNQELVDRASLAARASRRTTVLWTGSIDHDTVDETALALQNAWCRMCPCACESCAPLARLTRPSSLPGWTPSPAGVTVLRCERHEEVADHVLACEQRAAEDGAATAAQLMPDEVEDAMEGVNAYLGDVWGADKHHVRPHACREKPKAAVKTTTGARTSVACADRIPLGNQAAGCAGPSAERRGLACAALRDQGVCRHSTGPRSLPDEAPPLHAQDTITRGAHPASARALSTKSCSTLRSIGCSETGHSSERAREGLARDAVACRCVVEAQAMNEGAGRATRVLAVCVLVSPPARARA